jgi:hypothetical protein
MLRRGSLTFALLLTLTPFARAEWSAPASTTEAWDVSVTEHELPPHEFGTPPARPHGLTLPRLPAVEERPRWNRFDRSLAASYLVLSGLDAWQTGNLPAGFREGNPLVSSWAGDRPRLGQAVAFKAVVGWGAIELTRRLERPVHRRTVLVLMNVIQASVVAMNERRTGGILFR